MAMRVCGSGAFAAVGGIHASFGDAGGELAAASTVPIMLLQAGNDPSLEPVVAAVAKLPALSDKCVLRQYFDRKHGW